MSKRFKKLFSFVLLFAVVFAVTVIFSREIKANSFDTKPPTGHITSTNNIAAQQMVTLSLSDDAGIAGYYWGPSTSYNENPFTSTSASSVNVVVNQPGKYFLTVRDTSGKLSDVKTIAFFKTVLNGNGFTAPLPYILTESGRSFNLPGVSNNNGVSFLQWNTSANGTGASYAAGTNFTANGNITLYAQWDDSIAPGCNIFSTNNVASEQTVTFSFSDNAGIAGYYWGTSSLYSENQYTAASANTVSFSVDRDGTYYLTAKDIYGNFSETRSITFYYTLLTITNYGAVTFPDGTTPIYPKVLTESGKSFVLPEVTNSRGLIFSHWIRADGTAAPYADRAQYKVTGNNALETVWTDPIDPACSLYLAREPYNTTTLRLSYSDNLGVAGYYFGTSPVYSDNPYKPIPNGPAYEDVDTEGTYYLTVKDWYDNVSETKSLTLYRLTFDTTGGFWYPPEVLLPNTWEYRLPEPTKINCYFSTWNTAPDGSGTSYAAGTYFKVPGNITLYAQWNQAPDPTCSIKSTNNCDSSQTLTFTFSNYSIIAGYYWGTSPSYLQNQFIPMTDYGATTARETVTDDGTYYLTVKDTSDHISETKSITFYKTNLETNGGTLSFGYILTESGKSFTLPVPQKTNYSLVEWNTAPDGSGASYYCQAQYRADGNKTLYAQWLLRYFTIIYNYSYNGGTRSTQTGAVCAAGSEVDLTPIAFRNGWDFVGWNTDPHATTGLTSLTVGNDHITLYAIFRKIPVVTYNFAANGGEGVSVQQNPVHTGDPVDLTVTAYKDDWDFLGWNTDPEAHTGLSSFTMPDGDVTLYAIYKKNICVTFVLYTNYGSEKYDYWSFNLIAYNNEQAAVSQPYFYEFNIPTGWDVLGWTTSTAPDVGSLSDLKVSEDTTFYCLYKRELTLSYDANGGSAQPAAQTGMQYCNSYDISIIKDPVFTLADSIEKEGATFDGWTEDLTGVTRYNSGDTITISEDTTLYAAWTSGGTINIRAADKDGEPADGATIVIYDSNAAVIQTLTTDADGVCFIDKADVENARTITAYKQIGAAKGGAARAAARAAYDNVIYSLRVTLDTITSTGKWSRKQFNGTESISLKMSSPKMIINCSVSYYIDSRTGDYYSDILEAFKYINQYLQKATDGYAELGNVAIFSTTDQNAFYQRDPVVAKCDVQIRQYTSATWGSSVWPNAYINGAKHDWFYGNEYERIQMQKISTGKDISTHPWSWAKIVVHEMGHYIFGFYDEYLNFMNKKWSDIGRPEGAPWNYGLMESQYTDIEMSVPGDYLNVPTDTKFQTEQYWHHHESCWETFDWMFYLTGLHVSIPTSDRTYEEITNTVTFFDCRSTAGVQSSGAAEQADTEAPLFVMPYFSNGYLILKTDEDIVRCTVSDFGKENTANIQLNKVANGYQVSLAELDEDKRFLTVESADCVNTFDLYDLQLSAGNGFSNRNNSIMLLSETEQDCGVIIYNNFADSSQATTLSRTLALKVENGNEVILIGRAGFDGQIDYSSLSWYRLDNDTWTKITSSTYMGEYSSLETRCTVTQSGIYALMAEKKTADTPSMPSGQTFFTASSYSAKDGGINISISYQNENVMGYRVLYKAKDNSENTSTIILEPELTVKAESPDQSYDISVWAILNNGTELSLGETQTVVSGEYYQEGSCIPFRWVVKYDLQEQENEIVDDKDFDGDGFTNLQEYRNGTDPTAADITILKLHSVTLKDFKLKFNSTKKPEPKIVADSGVKYTVSYTSSDPDVAMIDKYGTIYGDKPGTAEIKVTVTDQYGNTVTDTCTVTVRYTLLQWILKILHFGWFWY